MEAIRNGEREIVVSCGRRFGKSAIAAYAVLEKVVENIFDLRDGKTKTPAKIWIVAPCVDEKTEALTKRGWLKYNELKDGDNILTLNKDGKAEWQKCLGVGIYNRKGLMISRKTRGHDSLTTVNHKWLVGYTTSNTGGKPRTLGYRFTKKFKNNEYILGATDVLNLPKKKSISDSLVELVGWYWTEGSDNGNGINISQNRGIKADRIRNALTKLWGSPQDKGNHIKPDYPAWTDWKKQYKDENNDNGVFYINSIGSKIIRDIAPDKVISNDFINLLTKEQLELLLEVSIMADGHKRERITENNVKHVERVIFQKRKDRLEQLQIVSQLAGYESTLLFSKKGNIWILSIFSRNKHWLGQGDKRKEVYYDGVVWCPRTPNATWLARRNGTVYFTGNSYELTQKVFDYLVKYFVTCFPDFSKYIKYRPNPTIKIPGRTRVECKSSENPAGLLGEELDFLVVDECSRVKREIYEAYLMPTLAIREGQALFISTPFGQNWFYDKFMQNPNSRFQYPSLDNPLVTKKEWDRQKKLLPSQVFAQEYEASFLPDAAAVFRGVDEVVEDSLEDAKDSNYIMGLDLAKHEDFTVITVFDTKTHKQVYFDRFNKIDYPFQKKRIIATAKRYNNARIIVDSTGVGEGIRDDLTYEGMFVDDFKFSNKSKKELIEKLSIMIEERNIRIADIQTQIDELKSFGYQLTDSGNVKYSAPEGLHDDCVIALALAVWGLYPGKGSEQTPVEEEIARITRSQRKKAKKSMI